MSFWRTVKRGFGYGFGGRLGWELGGLIWRWIARLVGFVVLAVGATWGLPMLGDSVATYEQVKKRYEHQQPAKQAARRVEE